jgi:hypothetical protein
MKSLSKYLLVLCLGTLASSALSNELAPPTPPRHLLTAVQGTARHNERINRARRNNQNPPPAAPFNLPAKLGKSAIIGTAAFLIGCCMPNHEELITQDCIKNGIPRKRAEARECRKKYQHYMQFLNAGPRWAAHFLAKATKLEQELDKEPPQDPEQLQKELQENLRKARRTKVAHSAGLGAFVTGLLMLEATLGR